MENLLLIEYLLPVVILLGMIKIGNIIEKNQLKKIKKREIKLYQKPYVNFEIKKWSSKRAIESAELVTGEVVISGNYFKNFLESLKAIFGGNLTTFESMMDIGRREAILRMREKVPNANTIINVKIESSTLNGLTNNKNSVPQIAIIAYGTAITFAK